MPYWTYNKVREALSSRRMRSEISPDMRSLEMNVFREEEIAHLVEVFMEAEYHIYLQVKKLLVGQKLDDLKLSSGTDLGQDTGFVLSDIAACLMGDVLMHQYILPKHEMIRFFLEPVIAEALATTSVKSLLRKDLPDQAQGVDFPLPFSVYLPHDLVHKYQDAEGRRAELMMNEVHVVAGSTYKDDGTKTFSMLTVDYYRGEACTYRRGILSSSFALSGDPSHSLDTLLSGQHMEADDIVAGQLVAKSEGSIIVRLILNLMLYWKSESADILRQINPEYEKGLRKLHGVKGKKRTRRKAKLSSIPKNEHFILGQNMDILRRRAEEAAARNETTEPASTGKRPRQHFRRSHWCWQPCGPERSRRKLIWRVISRPINEDMPPVEKVGYSVRS